MQVLMINGSPRVNGNTSIALNEMETVFKKNHIEVNTVQIGNMVVLLVVIVTKKANVSLMMK